MDLVTMLSEQYTNGFQNGVDHVMGELHEMLFNKEDFPSEEQRIVIRKVYDILYKDYAEKL